MDKENQSILKAKKNKTPQLLINGDTVIISQKSLFTL
jgi:hypothetical protein